LPFPCFSTFSLCHAGCLVVSEFMGCSRSLSGVLRVNPFFLEEVSDAIHCAVSMPLAERTGTERERERREREHPHSFSHSWYVFSCLAIVPFFLLSLSLSLSANFKRRFQYVMNHSLAAWARGFLADLTRAASFCDHLNLVQVGREREREVVFSRYPSSVCFACFHF